MNKRLFVFTEIFGLPAVISAGILVWNLYDISSKSTLGVVFGSVNSSVWELSKGLTLPFLLYGMIELLLAKPYFKNYVAAKALGLAVSLLLFFAAASVFGKSALVLFLSALIGFITSYFFTVREIGQKSFFAASWLFLAVIFIMLFSFTVYPLNFPLFCDPETGLYGVIPESFDMGAVVLSRL